MLPIVKNIPLVDFQLGQLPIKSISKLYFKKWQWWINIVGCLLVNGIYRFTMSKIFARDHVFKFCQLNICHEWKKAARKPPGCETIGSDIKFTPLLPGVWQHLGNVKGTVKSHRVFARPSTDPFEFVSNLQSTRLRLVNTRGGKDRWPRIRPERRTDANPLEYSNEMVFVLIFGPKPPTGRTSPPNLYVARRKSRSGVYSNRVSGQRGSCFQETVSEKRKRMIYSSRALSRSHLSSLNGTKLVYHSSSVDELDRKCLKSSDYVYILTNSDV